MSKEHVLSASDFYDKGAAVRLGRFFFRSRNYISAPIFIFLVGASFWEYENSLIIWTLGPLALFVGELLRFWAMRHIGRSARTRKDKARKLVTTGPYAFIRNPLYLGNNIILLGFCILSELIWFIPIGLGICFIFYSFIIIYEEELLKQRFGNDFMVYMEKTSRWLPTGLPIKRMQNLIWSNWREVFWRERSTLYGITIGICAFGMKELISRFI